MGRLWATFNGTPQEYVERCLRSVEFTFPQGNPHFKADFVAEVKRLAALRIPGGNLRACVGVAIATA